MDQAHNSGQTSGGGPRKKKDSGAGRVAGRICFVLFTLLVIGVLTCGIFFKIFMTYVNTTLAPTLDVTVEEMTLRLSSVLYDKNGNEMRTLYSKENRELVSLDQIPQHMIDALVSIEDHRFYEHHGVDWEGTLAAMVKTFTSGSTRGGSTITQQLLRYITQDDDVTVKRKVREIFRALKFEESNSKEDILELYLNYIYFGQSCYGVQSAANVYFGKDVSKLSLAESACIIGITNNPSLYDPFLGTEFKQSDGTVKTTRDFNKRRQETILDRMEELGKITAEECAAAKAETLLFTDTDAYKTLHGEEISQEEDLETASRNVYSWFEDAVIEDAIALVMEAKGCSSEVATSLVYSGGYHIFTTLDPDIQAIVDSVYTNLGNFDYPSAKGTQLDSAITIVDPYTGDVVAMAGGVGQKTVNRGLNLATARRPCGSAIKPVSVYAPAFDANVVSPASVIDDYPLRLNDSSTGGFPKNSNGKYRGMLTVPYAIQWSTNTVAARTLEKLGYGASFSFMENNLGFDLADADMALSPLSMGGLTYGVTTEEMAAAFGAFANSGIYTYPRTITKILDNDGNVVADNTSRSQVAMKETTAYLMNKMLRSVVSGGTGGSASFSGMTIAGKTGTTNDNFDRYFVGYTPYYSAAVWVGYAQSNEKINAGSKNPAALVWKQIMEQIHANLENKSFPERPSGITSVTVCMDCGLLATDLCAADQRGSRVTTVEVQAEAAPTEKCTCHIQVEVCGDSGMLCSEFCPAEGRVARVVINPAREYVAYATPIVNADGTTSPSYILPEDDVYTMRYLEAQGACTTHTDDVVLPGDDDFQWPDWPWPDGLEEDPDEPDVPDEPGGGDGPVEPGEGGGEPEEPEEPALPREPTLP